MLIPEQIGLTLSVHADSKQPIKAVEMPSLNRQTVSELAAANLHALDCEVMLPVESQALFINTRIDVYEGVGLSGNDCSLNIDMKLPFPTNEGNARPSTYRIEYRISEIPGYFLLPST